MIITFTDFGHEGPYLTQMKAAIYSISPHSCVLDLFSNVPKFQPGLAGYLLSAYIKNFQESSVFLCVIDPDVGTEQRQPIVAKIGPFWFVGPHNGIFDVLLNIYESVDMWRIEVDPAQVSATFHGRDVFAPIAALIDKGIFPSDQLIPLSEWNRDPDVNALELEKIIYVDHYGNLMTGLLASLTARDCILKLRELEISYARTFFEVTPGRVFWFENANGLVEIAINRGNASTDLSVNVGESVSRKKNNFVTDPLKFTSPNSPDI